jgi:hypothetical protein
MSKMKMYKVWLFLCELSQNKQANSFAGYPPADPDVGVYLSTPGRLFSRHGFLIRHLSFLEALFTEVTKQLESYEPSTRENIARQWYEWLKEDATSLSYGLNRTELYRRVVANSEEVCNALLSC